MSLVSVSGFCHIPKSIALVHNQSDPSLVFSSSNERRVTLPVKLLFQTLVSCFSSKFSPAYLPSVQPSNRYLLIRDVLYGARDFLMSWSKINMNSFSTAHAVDLKKLGTLSFNLRPQIPRYQKVT